MVAVELLWWRGTGLTRLARLVCCLDYPSFERIHSRESVFEIIAGNICVSYLQFSGANKAELLVGDAKQKCIVQLVP